MFKYFDITHYSKTYREPLDSSQNTAGIKGSEKTPQLYPPQMYEFVYNLCSLTNNAMRNVKAAAIKDAMRAYIIL